MKKIGAYLPGAYEEVVDVVDAYVLTEKVSCKAMSSIIIIDSQRKLPTSCDSTESMTSEKRLLQFRTGDMSLPRSGLCFSLLYCQRNFLEPNRSTLCLE